MDEKLLISIAEELGTPFYFIDEKLMLKNLERLENAFSGFKGSVKVAYSVKANFNPLVLKSFASRGTLFDVASEEELFFLKKSGVHASKAIYSSVSETREELDEAISSGVNLISIGSKMGLLRLNDLLKRKRVEQRVLIRVNPEVEANAAIPASGRWSKFGVPLGEGEDSARFLLLKAKENPLIRTVGVHFHLGSQVLDSVYFSIALDKVLGFLSSVKDGIGLDFEVIDVGGAIQWSTPYKGVFLYHNPEDKRLDKFAWN